MQADHPAGAPRLSKSKLTAVRQCPKRLWLELHKPQEKFEDASTERRFATGHQVGEIARSRHPGGLLIAPDNDLRRALAETRLAIDSGAQRPLFEATFESHGVLVRADLLLPERSAWHMVEVKSSTQPKFYHLEDAAIQAWVVRGAGVRLAATSLQVIDSSWVYPGGGDYAGLLRTESIDEAIEPLVDEVPHWLEEAREVATGAEPQVRIGSQCTSPFDCGFRRYCSKGLAPVELPVAWIPHLSASRKAALEEAGIVEMRDLPMEGLTAKQQEVAQAYLRGVPVIKPLGADVRRRFGGTRYYLDFESVQFGVPIWAGTRPYQQIPFQWSCHIEEPGKPLRHEAFLDFSGEDPSLGFVESLMTVLGHEGPVIVCSQSFEATRLRELADRFPTHAKALDAIVGRMVDLLPITREHYFHPGLEGSWSIKNVLRTLRPDLDYANLQGVSDGSGASEAYLEAIDPASSPERVEAIRRELLTYCARDTEAMIHVLYGLSGAC